MNARLDPLHMREPGYPPHGLANITLIKAVRIARHYGGRIPTVAQLRADFGMSRATAYRWRAAFLEGGAEA